MTNADKIRSMTDEELCHLLIKVDLHCPPYCDGLDGCENNRTCDTCCTDWLKQEVKDNA